MIRNVKKDILADWVDREILHTISASPYEGGFDYASTNLGSSYD